MPNANNKGADQPARQRSLISAFVVRCLDSIIPQLAISEISRPYLVSSAEQVGLSLKWSQTLKTGLLVTWLVCKFTAIYFHDIVTALVKMGYERNKSVRGAPYDFRKAPSKFENL